MLTTPFPNIERDPGKEDANPGIQLFGQRLFSSQSAAELLVELLLVATSAKRIGDDLSMPATQLLPELGELSEWPTAAPLRYAPRSRLNLKLFSFLGVSNLDTRHASHREHYRDLLDRLRGQIDTRGGLCADEVMRTLGNLFLGFQGTGANRTWCAQAFLPVCRELIAGETMWNDSVARKSGVEGWKKVCEAYRKYFSESKHIFLARGGELLYLQLCNVLRRADHELAEWNDHAGTGLSPDECTAAGLHRLLSSGFERVLGACPEALGNLARFIDTGVETETRDASDGSEGSRRWTACGWCPEESWREGFLFAVELSRICSAAMDPIDRLEVLSTACAIQELRSLCAQSARYAPARNSEASPLGYVWTFSDPAGDLVVPKEVSRRCLKAVERMISEAIRHPEIKEEVDKQSKKGDPYKQADTHYGHKLFLTVSKRLGLVIPRRGRGARFVLNGKLLRFLVLALVPPQERLSYQTFKDLAFAHFGMAFDDDRISRACAWCGQPRLGTLGEQVDEWLQEMLDAAGVLQRLSDSCALVHNPFEREEGEN